MSDNLIFKLIKKLLLGHKEELSGQTGQLVRNMSRNGIKDCFTGEDSLSIRGAQKLLKTDINKKARSILKKAIDEPEILLDFIESKNTVIVKSQYMDRILKAFGETEGFITPMTGLKALFFTIIVNMFSKIKLKTGFKTPIMFALKDEPVNIYVISHQFHLWLSYINKLPGFEDKNMQNFRKYWNVEPENKNASTLSIEEILSLKDIIAREMEALDFVREIAREFVGQKTSLKKLKEGKSVNL